MENPYQNRKAIENPDEFFGRKREISRIFALISNAAEPHSISIVGERGIGKSSLFHFVKNEATKKKYLEDYGDYIFVYLKLSSFVGYDTEEFCGILLKELSSAASEKIPSSSNSIYGALENFIEMLSLKGKRIIFMFAEFDSILEIPAFNSDLLGYFRGLINSYSLSFITSSRVPISELTETKNSLRAEIEFGSPFFNIFYNISLGYLEKQEALELIEKPSSKQKVRFNKEDENFIDEIAFLHPFFIQVACYHLFNLRKEENKINGEKLDKRIYDMLFQRFYEETVGCWDFYLDHLDQEEKEVLLKICEGEKIPSKRGEAIHRLYNKSLICEKDGRWRIFSIAFAYYILGKSSC